MTLPFIILKCDNPAYVGIHTKTYLYSCSCGIYVYLGVEDGFGWHVCMWSYMDGGFDY